MNVSCPECRSVFRVDPTKIPTAGVRARCSVCGGVITIGKGGAIENLELWQKLDQAASAHTVSWRWVRGHAGHPKNEYADALAITAAQRQERSDGLRPSGFDAWLGAEQRAGRYGGYDPDKDIHDRA